MNEEKYGWLIALSVPFIIGFGIMVVVAGPVWIIGYVIALLSGNDMPF